MYFEGRQQFMRHNTYLMTFNNLTRLPLEKMADILADDNFKCIFLNENDRIPFRISRSNWQYSSIGLDNGLAPNKWQAIIWTNYG